MQRRFDFNGRFDNRQELGDGSVKFSARLTRTGVFDYGDHKEARFPDEVFKEDALNSFKGLTITEGHAAWVNPENWKEIAVGHIADDVHQDGEHVAASLIIKDKRTLAKIDAGELVELSMGYSVELEQSRGKTDSGEEYDSIQRGIRGNHAALGPKNWGRAGTSARLLDGTYALPEMTTQRIDAPAELDALRAERDSANKRADKAEAERDTAKKEAADAKTRSDAAEASFQERVAARVDLQERARVVLGADYKFASKSDKEIRIDALKKVDSDFTPEGKTDAYLEVRFDLDCKRVKSAQADLASTNTAIADAQNAPVEDPISAAQKRVDEENKKRNANGAPLGALTK